MEKLEASVHGPVSVGDFLNALIGIPYGSHLIRELADTLASCDDTRKKIASSSTNVASVDEE